MYGSNSGKKSSKKSGGSSMASSSGAGMKGRDMFTGARKGSASSYMAKPSGYGGMKNSTYLRPQPK